MLQSVADRGSNANEQIEHAAKVLRKSANCKKVFTAIYTDKRKSKTIADLITATKLNNKQILKEGKKLASNDLVVQTKVDKSTAYEKINFFQHHREAVLRLANNSWALQKFPTKRKLQARVHIIKVGEVKVEKRMITPRSIT